jgi:hypothetical protein
VKIKIYVILVLMSAIVLNCAPANEHRLAAGRMYRMCSPKEFMVSAMITFMEATLEPTGIFQKVSVEEGKKIRDAIDGFAMAFAEDPELERRMVDLYVETYSVSELDQIEKFYDTPVGKKCLIEMPRLFQRGAEIGREIGEKHQAKFLAALSESFE